MIIQPEKGIRNVNDLFYESERKRIDHVHYCQKCSKYRPRSKVRHLNRKKAKLDKIKQNEKY